MPEIANRETLFRAPLLPRRGGIVNINAAGKEKYLNNNY